MVNNNEERLENFYHWYEENQKNYHDFSELVLNKICVALQERKLSIAYSSFREKNPTSLRDKCQKTIVDLETGKTKLKYTNPKNEITDFAGVRIVTYLKSDVFIVKKIIENLFVIDEDNSGDKIDTLSENEIGYLSMHYVVSLRDYSYENTKYKDYKCEIQIRTVLQDAWAQIFHDRQYKTGTADVKPDYELKRKTCLIAGALELIDDQIEELVKEYDSMNKEIVKEQKYQNILESLINHDSLFRYCQIKFKDRINRYYNAESTLSLLTEYSLKYIKDIDNIVEDRFVKVITESKQITIDKLIAYILIIKDPKRYFSLNSSDTFKTISSESFELISKFADIEDICKQYNVTIENE